MELGRQLRVAREAAGLSQREVARRAGFSHARLSEYERGLRDLTVARLAMIADVVEADLDIRIAGTEVLEAHDVQVIAINVAQSPKQRLDTLVRLHRLRGRAS